MAAIATGRARALPNSIWVELTTDGTTGWSSFAFLAFPGDVIDRTAEVVAGLGGIPSAETMLELGLLVAEFFASDEPPSDVVVSAAPTVGDLGEVIYDVIGLGDDAVRGFRLHVFGTPEGGSFALKSVEATLLCSRGVSGGLCN